VVTLHYIHDPLCGWCYAAAPLVAVARELLPVRAHGGGLMVGARRQQVTPQLRDYVMAHDRRIAQASHQPFGERYFEGLLRDPEAVFDSVPPITAMLAADALGDRGLDLLARMQRAHYVEGRRIAEPEVLAELAADIGLDKAAFLAQFNAVAGAATQAHIQDSRALLAKAGGSGFPTLVLERDGQLAPLDISSFIGEPYRWRAWLHQERRSGSR
jgi:putative protein-disulfide isomerase